MLKEEEQRADRFLKARWCCTAIASLLRHTLTVGNTKSPGINIQCGAALHMLCFEGQERHNITADLQSYCFLTRRDRDL